MKKTARKRERPTQERARDTVEVILEATERLARKVGFEAATTKDIARVAGVSVGTFYRYFPSKEALLRGVVERQFVATLHAFGERMAFVRPGPFDRMIEEIVEAAFRMMEVRLEQLGSMHISFDSTVHIDAEMIENAVSLVHGVLQRRSDILQVEPKNLRTASILIVRGVVFLSRIGIRDYPDLVKDGAYVSELAKMMSRYLMAPPLAPGASGEENPPPRG